MIFLKRILDYAIFTCVILLTFFLVFEQYLEIPGFIGWLGRWHPLVLHFPIVLILVTVVQYWRRDNYFDWYLNLTTFLTLITAITGFVLSLEGPAKGNLILTHQWLGISVAYLMAIWYWVNKKDQSKYLPPIMIQGVLVIMIVVTGHYGGMVTHGNDFLSLLDKDEVGIISIPDDPIVFTHIIQPILNRKCVKCHNSNKAKAELILSGMESINKGGKSGAIIDRNDYGKSKLLASITLSPEDDGHMPPLEEEQLTGDEMTLISSWVSHGASGDQKFSDLDISDPGYVIIDKIVSDSKNYRWSGLPDISDDEIDELSSNYIRILRFYNRSDAIQVIVYPHKNYESKGISKLKSIANNIIELSFSGIPVQNDELDFIGLCQNLEKLNLSNTGIDDEGVSKLKDLGKLTELKIYNSNITDKALDKVEEYPQLSRLYAYNSDITEEGINRLAKAKSGLSIIKNAKEAEDFKSVLPPPTANPRVYFFSEIARLKLNHPLQDIDIFYTTDGSMPGETSDKAEDSLEIKESLKLKFYAARSGWESSHIDSMNIYKTISQPDSYFLKNQPNPRFIGRGESLLFDKEKGPGNFGDSTWMAFREESFILNGEWEESVTIKAVVLSSMVNTDPYLFPPESIKIRGGMDKSDMRVLARLNPKKMDTREDRHFRFFECTFDPVMIRYLEIEVQPLQRIPMWHPGKGEKGWFFIDEVVIE
jgi:uncharacterized membrane protein